VHHCRMQVSLLHLCWRPKGGNFFNAMEDIYGVVSGMDCKEWEGCWLVPNVLHAFGATNVAFFGKPGFIELGGEFSGLDEAAACAQFEAGFCTAAI